MSLATAATRNPWLISAPQGRTDFIEADLRQPLAILAEAARTPDFARPVALVLTAILTLSARATARPR
jgi:hypothetical protein